MARGAYRCYCGQRHDDINSRWCPGCKKNITLNGIRAADSRTLTEAEMEEFRMAWEKAVMRHHRSPGVVMAPALTGSPDLYPRRFPVMDQAVRDAGERLAEKPDPDRLPFVTEDEPGYRSAWHIGPIPKDFPEKEAYQKWRRGRKEFIATFSDEAKEEMLSAVTPQTVPPLASDIARLLDRSGPAKGSEEFSWPRMGAALVLGAVAAVMLGLGFWVSGALFFTAALIFGLKSWK